MLLTILAAIPPGTAQTQKRFFKIKYISADFVYLDGGKEDGLSVGDTLGVFRGKKRIATLVVSFLAQHSASCKIVESEGRLQVGDQAVLLRSNPVMGPPQSPDSVKQAGAGPIPAEQKGKPKKSEKARKSRGARTSGYLALQWYSFNDRGQGNLDFTQPTARFNLKVTDLWNRDFRIRIRSRARYNRRTRDYSTDIPGREWRNRIYEFSFGYQAPDAPIHFQVGRIISNQMSGVGYLDGLLVQNNLSPGWQWGILAGTQPEWQYSDFQTSIQKYGVFVAHQSGTYRTTRFQTTAAVVGAYHGSLVSREYVYLQTTLNRGNRLHFYQSTEVDVNRGWRREAEGRRFTLSSLFLSGRIQAAPFLSVGVSLDNRKNYRTYETRSIVDSLFDDLLRKGVRGNLTFSFPHHWRISANLGVRDRESDPKPTYSFGGSLFKTNFLFSGIFLNLRASGFSSTLTNGVYSTLRLGKYFRKGHSLNIFGGRYRYNFSNSGGGRKNTWFGANLQLEILRHFYLSGELQIDTGDDVKGQRFFGELGYRF